MQSEISSRLGANPIGKNLDFLVFQLTVPSIAWHSVILLPVEAFVFGVFNEGN